jgi:flagellar biosynthesis protein FliR
MTWLEQITAEKVILLTLIVSRVGGLVATAPIFASRDAPMQFRALLAMAVALLILPGQWTANIPYPTSALDYLLLVVGEALVGVSLGLGIDIVFSGVQMAGQLIGRISGETLAEVYDPTYDEGVPVLGHFLSLLTLAVFVTIGGHRMVMAGLIETFQTIRLGTGGGVSDGLVDALVTLLTQSFVLGIRAAAPAMMALLLASLVIGLISRTLPQLNVMAWGFSLNSLTGYAVLLLSLSGAAWVFQEQVEPALEMLLQGLTQPGMTARPV